MSPEKRDEYRRAHECVAKAKDELLDALRIAESAGLKFSARIDSLCGQVETLQGKLQELSK